MTSTFSFYSSIPLSHTPSLQYTFHHSIRDYTSKTKKSHNFKSICDRISHSIFDKHENIDLLSLISNQNFEHDSEEIVVRRRRTKRKRKSESEESEIVEWSEMVSDEEEVEKVEDVVEEDVRVYRNRGDGWFYEKKNR